MATTFIINKRTKIVAKTQSTRTGFRHLVEYYSDGKLVESRRVSYLNRTWESYQYESAIKSLLKKMRMSPSDTARILSITSGTSRSDLKNRFRTTSNVASLGDVFGKTKKEKNDWKLRMIKAGAGAGLILPDNWDSLSENEKERRLNLIIKELKGF